MTKQNSLKLDLAMRKSWTPERKKAFSEKWSGENSPSWKGGVTTDKEYRREYNRRWRAANPERAKLLWESSHNKNRERYLLLKRVWQKNNYAKSLENNRKWRAANPDKVKLYKLRDREKNRARIYFRNSQREYRERGAEGAHTLEEWLALKAKYGNKCVNCQKPEPKVNLTRDHIVPLITGGKNSIDNIQPLCGICNSSKMTKVINYLI